MSFTVGCVKIEGETMLTARASPHSRRDDRREAILDAARTVFLSEGYGAASMSRIAVLVGGSKGTLYNYFKSKEELFAAFMERACGGLADDLFIIPDDGRDLRPHLNAIAKGFIRLLLSPDALALHRLVVGEGERFPELGPTFYNAGPRLIMDRITAEFADLMKAGRLRPGAPRQAAAQFKDLSVSGMHHMRLWGMIADPTDAEVDAQAATAVDTFLRAYAPD